MKCRACQSDFASPVQTFIVLGRTIRLRPITCPKCIASNGKPTTKTTTPDLFTA